jgi:hypothetical protein
LDQLRRLRSAQLKQVLVVILQKSGRLSLSR